MCCVHMKMIYAKFEDLNERESINYHELNVREIKKYFDDKNKHPLKSRVNVILLLSPVKNKKELSDLLKYEINVVASAPTSFGKSLRIY